MPTTDVQRPFASGQTLTQILASINEWDEKSSKVMVHADQAGGFVAGGVVTLKSWDATEGDADNLGLPTVEKADSGTAKMPAYGMIRRALADNANGAMVVRGVVKDVDTSGMTLLDPIYVSETAGEFTNVAPTDAQVIGVVLNVNASTGVVWVDFPVTPLPSFDDASFAIFDDADNTKIFKFQLGDNTTAQTRTWKPQDWDGVLAGVAEAELNIPSDLLIMIDGRHSDFRTDFNRNNINKLPTATGGTPNQVADIASYGAGSSAINFDGVDEYLRYDLDNSNGSPGILNDVGIRFKCKFTVIPSVEGTNEALCDFDKKSAGDVNRLLIDVTTAADEWRILIWDGAGNALNFASSGAPVVAGVLYDVAFFMKNTAGTQTAELWVNGVLVASGSDASWTNRTATDLQLHLGDNHVHNEEFNGQIQDFQVRLGQSNQWFGTGVKKIGSGHQWPDSIVDLPVYTVTTLPTGRVGGFIYVSNEAGGAVPAFFDGSDWRRVQDRVIVS